MKKRLIAVVVAVCALAVLAVGSTFAFFTSKDNAGNTFTMGNVQIELTETTDRTDDDIYTAVVEDNNKGITYGNVLPNTEISKKPIVTNTGANDAWIRVQLDVTTTSENETMQANIAELKQAIIADMVANYGWAVKADDDGYIYYTSVLAPDAVAKLFETVSIPKTWGNEAANAGFSIEISAQAVQSDNNGSSWDTAEWLGFEDING